MKRLYKDTRILLIFKSTNNPYCLIPNLTQCRQYMHISDYTIKKLIKGERVARRFKKLWMDKYKLQWAHDYEQENHLTINGNLVNLE